MVARALKLVTFGCARRSSTTTMPVHVESEPHPTAWTLTLDIGERQVLVGYIEQEGMLQHRVLWYRVADERWIVTTPSDGTASL